MTLSNEIKTAAPSFDEESGRSSFHPLAYTASHSERGCNCRQDADGYLQHHLPCVFLHSLSNLKG